ncbi:hypothetical protein WN48_09702 [Eufriesea mexicana]|uniref:Uncharacterized protein n=2 Tax=Eufriesea mexicana TaxID=516756 RepID=A0A310S707_9HYME|nr:hypothetical protein WN48_09702 [Eufriesea mexicana]
MRRMYGDERHLNVLRAEFERNDIELKYDDYYHHFSDDYRKYQYTHDYEYFEADESLRNGNEFEGRGFTSKSFNENAAKRLNKFPKLSEYTRPHFRPTEKTSVPTSTTTTTTTPSTITATSSKETASSTLTSSTPLTTQESTSKSTSSTTSSLNSTSEEKRTSEEITMSPTVTTSYMVKEQNFSINEISEQIDRIDEVVEETGEVAEVSESTLEETSTVSLSETTELPVEVDGSKDLLATTKETTAQEETSSSSEQQEFRPRPEYRPANKPEASTMEGQLYQDVAAKDQQEQPVLKLRGV